MVSYIKNKLQEDEEYKRYYAEEALIFDVAESIWEAMESQNLSRKDLADKMGTSRAYITQLLNGSRNMTLRSLASIAYILKKEVTFSLSDSADEGNWQHITNVITNKRQTFQVQSEILSANDSNYGWHPARSHESA